MTATGAARPSAGAGGELDAVDAGIAAGAVDRHAFGPDEPDMAQHLEGAIQMIRAASGTAIALEQFHVIDVDDAGRTLRHWADVGVEQLQAQLRTAVSV